MRKSHEILAELNVALEQFATAEGEARAALAIKIKDLTNGDGLGLPICKELADQMGATIRINSVPDKGTTVWISIPCSVGEMERKPETQPQP